MLIHGKFDSKKQKTQQISSIIATYDIKLSDTLSYKVSLMQPQGGHREFDIVVYGSDVDSSYNMVMESDFYKNFLIPWVNNSKDVSEAHLHDDNCLANKPAAKIIDFSAALKKKTNTELK